MPMKKRGALVTCFNYVNRATPLIVRKVEEAHKSVHGLGETAIQQKYVELVRMSCLSCFVLLTNGQYSEMKRLEREYSKEKQKLQKDKDTGLYRLPYRYLHSYIYRCFIAKGQLTKANQMKAKMENIARDLNKVEYPKYCNWLVVLTRLQANRKLRVSCFTIRKHAEQV